ncbi:hypothetical protein ABAC460_04085 [Asticcacaulis sp. AC460]|uniref:DUF805 domain-containing protein n=1 Tax=Asticcacaulis sp. AC460 TaxID=1282360 RepID=UPI0003C3DF92|nr:DUF805 domain-containing protein [Asticcacaulis sp. AC460]ESQ92075.1 hypothetical protein ABAC460_04085 [Asticcacaulis sp. AC460]
MYWAGGSYIYLFMAGILGAPVIIGVLALWLIKPGTAGHYGPLPTRKSIASAVLTVYRKTFMWKGRASRSEIWWYLLFVFTVQSTVIFLLAFRNGTIDNNINLALNALCLPTGLAVGARRLHDIGRSAWWLLLGATGTGYLVLLVLWQLPPGKDIGVSQAEVFD